MKRRHLCAAGACLAVSLFAGPAAKQKNNLDTQRRKEVGSQTQQEIERLEREVAAAAALAETTKMARFFAPGFFAIDATGRELGAEEVLARRRTPGYEVKSLRHENIRVRSSGACAIVTAETALEARYQGRDVSGDYPYLRVWQKQGEEWRALVTVGFPARQKPGEADAQSKRDAEEVARLDREVGDALTRADAKRLRELVAEDFVATNPQGRTMTREEAIAVVTAPDYRPDFIVNEILDVRIFGDVALVRALGKARGRIQGQEVSAQFTYLRVWARRNGKWQAVAAQATMAPER
jgi:ketosteroid isomerase-like protein